MPHLQGKDIPMFASASEDKPREKVGSALVVHHDEGVVEFYVRLTDEHLIKQLRQAPVQGLFFEMSRPISLENEYFGQQPLEFPIEVVEVDGRGYL